ncbi:MAG TPA: Gfo/Idh/MocA family oxidoreductase [Azospirillaceae bacterium]|nr:Gfo/Idh/MocA family oxidoreductase [Azospirillaceae bacterium]
MRRLNAGVVGLGVGEQHILGYRQHPACTVALVADPDPEKRAQIRERYPDVRVTADPAEVLGAPDIDVVSIASPDDAHCAQVVDGLTNGKHLFIEKPVCLTEAEFAEIEAAAARRPDLRISSNLILRATPRFADLKARIDRGEFGEIYHVEADYNYGRLHKILSGWRGAIPNYSVMLGGGVHMVDMVRWLIGGEATDVAAFGNKICSRDTTFAGNDLTTALIRFDTGATAKVTANFGCVQPHVHKLAVYGTKATFENDFGPARLWTSRDAGEPPAALDTLYKGAPKGALIPGFVDHILGGPPGLVQKTEVFETMRLCFAIDRAAREGRVVSHQRPTTVQRH